MSMLAKDIMDFKNKQRIHLILISSDADNNKLASFMWLFNCATIRLKTSLKVLLVDIDPILVELFSGNEMVYVIDTIPHWRQGPGKRFTKYILRWDISIHW